MTPAVILPDGAAWTELRPAKWTQASHGEPNTQANAAFIVRAVNAHDELLEALKETFVLASLLFKPANVPQKNEAILARAYKAIAKAEGRAQ